MQSLLSIQARKELHISTFQIIKTFEEDMYGIKLSDTFLDLIRQVIKL
jgi:hypothetical protein